MKKMYMAKFIVIKINLDIQIKQYIPQNLMLKLIKKMIMPNNFIKHITNIILFSKRLMQSKDIIKKKMQSGL